ncbi:DNA helicase Rep [Glaciecola petra]|uniref:ATP-dependent DNA helicase Rep n=1 Tax=Glaciecola petra TaxID=3075602 RepID=A0ABU2ZXZ2_9ALTE|nr:DNA helicase Rep [Aestuariibacter sp. P117]MDT0596449.1 DNA helicase Rep [Aestuariibacter sp. P117]
MKLNPAQQEAVEYISGPCLVLAGAGSGKTRVITNKIAYLVNECAYKPSQIAAVTFTNKAAREMKERVSSTLGKKASRGLKVSTFHTLGLNIIKKHITTLGYKAGFSLFDDKDTFALLNDLSMNDYNGDKDEVNALIRSISNWKNELMMPHQVLQRYKTGIEAEHGKWYEEYTRHMMAYNALDFDDLIMLPTVLLADDKAIREKWQMWIRYLLVDEYQDTNTSQYQLVRLLVGERARFTVVGDDDQSIYSWRGAQPKNLKLLNQDYPSLKLIKLEQNYRSSQRILHCANILIENNPHVFEKKLFSTLSQGEKLSVLVAKNEENEADKVIAELMAQKFMQDTQYKDYAILYRSNHQSRVFEKALMKNRIPYKISGGMSFFGRAEVKDMMAYLRLLTNQDDDNALLRVINTPVRGIGRATLAKLGEFAHLEDIALFEAMCHEQLHAILGAKAATSVEAFTRLIVMTSDNLARGDSVAVLRDFIKTLQYEEHLYAHANSPKVAEISMKNVSTLFTWVQDLLKGDALNAPMSMPEVVQRLTLRDMMERGEDDGEADQVQLMTLHSSKGLEFPNVFLIGMEEGLLPHQSSIDEDNIEEERRLAYVGITRAQQKLTFSVARERRQMGEFIEPTPSRFLYELPSDDIEWEWQKTPDSDEVRKSKTAKGLAGLKSILGD